MRRIKSPNKQRLIVAYVRVSTQEQADKGSSLDAQRDRLRNYATATGRETVHEFMTDDGFSGASVDRPAMQRLLSLIRAGEVEAVLTTKLDRLSRSLRDVLDLLDLCESTGTALVSASEALDTSSAVGKMLIHLLASFGEFERGRISERTSDVLSYKRRSGHVYGPTPYGYRREGDRLVQDATQQSALALAREWDSEGLSLRAIARALTAALYEPPKGKAWHPSSVQRILSSRMTTEHVA
jgi:site-specific DNA recombinase